MKTDTTRRVTRLFTLLLVASALASCKLPPRYAMREIQNKGLFTYLGTDYSRGYYGSGAYASAAPFQLQRPYAEPRPTQQVPYRSTYHSNRHMKADYTRTPYRPRTVTRSSSAPSTSSRAHRPSPAVVEAPSEPSRTSLPPAIKPLVTADKAVTDAPKSSTTSPAPAAEESLPFGTPVVGRPGMVISPYTDASKKQLVDVTGLPPGEKVKDPYSGKLFRVPPPAAQAENKAKPLPEAPAKPEGEPKP